MDFILFPKSMVLFLVVGLEKWSKDLGFRNLDGISSLLDFEFVARALLRLLSFFLINWFFYRLFEKKSI